MVTNPTSAREKSEDAILRVMLRGGMASVVFWMAMQIIALTSLGRMLVILCFVTLAGLAVWKAVSRKYADCCCLLAYLTAVEPAVRGLGDRLPYLSLEYLLILVSGLVFLQRRASLWLPVLFLSFYFLLELAGVGASANPDEARWMTVMTGARLALFLLFQRAWLSPADTVRVVAAYAAGTLAMAGMGLRGAFAADTKWTEQSNSRASGGFGPNQVAGLLALGAFATIFLADLDRRSWARVLYLGAAGMQILSALFTFTRGGSVILGLGILLYALILLGCRRLSVAVLGLGIVLIGVCWVAIQVTDQVLLARYQDTEMSGREGIWSLGLRIFWENPLFGVGTGNFYEASQGRLAAYHGRVGTHNELIRALSEHGIVGAVLWLSFVAACVTHSWKTHRGLARAGAMSWVLMAVAFECHSGLKLSMSMLFMALAVMGFRRDPLPAAIPVQRVPSRDRSRRIPAYRVGRQAT